MTDKKPKKQKPLTKAQKTLLACYQREGFRLYGPEHRPNRTLQILVERGFLKRRSAAQMRLGVGGDGRSQRALRCLLPGEVQ